MLLKNILISSEDYFEFYINIQNLNPSRRKKGRAVGLSNPDFGSVFFLVFLLFWVIRNSYHIKSVSILV